MAHTMQRVPMEASTQLAGKRSPVQPVRVGRRVARSALKVQAVAAPERVDMKGVQRPDNTGRFGK